MAHRGLRQANVLVDGQGKPWLIDFGFAEFDASTRRLNQDIVAMLASLACLVGPRAPLTSAFEVLGKDAVIDAMPLLQLPALSTATRTDLKKRPGLLEDIRGLAEETTGEKLPPPQRLTRLPWRPRLWQPDREKRPARSDSVNESSGESTQTFVQSSMIRLFFATAILTGSAVFARRRTVDPIEGDVFRFFNRLPKHPSLIIQIIMQAGALGASFVAAAMAIAAGQRRMARDLALSGVCAWFTAKIIKNQVARGRPTDVFDDVQVHGAEATGLGFPSGHAAVSAALATAAGPYLPRWARQGAWVTAGIVAFARIYVGAHLPVDIMGGVPLGILAATGLRLLSYALGISGPVARKSEARADSGLGNV